ncbi:LysR family transcriptional regulator [Bacterioplanes sanyensis]|uniref:LysR family transcriptional regulator n=1 Tax=Bacterioplanes sanyensis TaxID=1249553 RepID=A0A222FFV6_9GAMM|nr:LysR family transcriptional regulator [Bacterioplanes sanyensis]ASP37629.1 LysR family transcriptional regulator [Bacterioplanes sanyensis]
MINPVWLRTFCTLVEVNHFTRTAERLHMTQPGVSQHIHKLEQQLGHTLLERQGKGFALSNHGERLYQRGRQLLQQWQGLEQHVREDPEDEGVVHILSPGSIGLKFYPQCLELQQRHPKLVVDYRFAPNLAIEQALVAGEADVGLLTELPRHGELLCQPMAEEALLLVTSSKETAISWQRLLELGFINHPDGAYHARRLLSANFGEFESVSQLPVTGFSNQIGLILEPVARGLGFTVLPETAVAMFPQKKDIRSHLLTHAVSETIYQVKNKHSAELARVRFFEGQLRSLFSTKV